MQPAQHQLFPLLALLTLASGSLEIPVPSCQRFRQKVAMRCPPGAILENIAMASSSIFYFFPSTDWCRPDEMKQSEIFGLWALSFTPMQNLMDILIAMKVQELALEHLCMLTLSLKHPPISIFYPSQFSGLISAINLLTVLVHN